MKIYTRSGDTGKTSLIYGRRIEKDAARVEAYGTVDECNSAIGFAVALLPVDAAFDDLRRICVRLQRDLFDVGRDLATPEDKRDGFYVEQKDIDLLEHVIDCLDCETPPLTQFVLPGGHVSAAAFHVARTTTRHAERLVVTVQKQETVSPMIQKYLNRLSDLLFVMARVVNARTQTPEPTVNFQSEKPEPYPHD